MMLQGTLITLLGICALFGASGSGARTGQGADLETGFDNPPLQARPLGWWHWINGNVSKEGIRADLENMKAIGMGGVQLLDVEIYMPPGPVRYGSDAWHDHVQYAIKTAAELGLEFHMSNAPGWSASGGPWVTPEFSMKQLVWSETETGGGEISIELPRSKTRHRYTPRHPVDLEFYEDVAVIAVPRTTDRLADVERKTVSAARPVRRLFPEEEVETIPLGDVIDLTAKVSEDGQLRATLPEGDWVVLRFGMITSGMTNHPAQPEGTGLEIDKLDAAAVAFQFEQALSRIIEEAGPHAGTAFNGILFDSFEGGFQTWSRVLPDEFFARKGYEFVRYLPLMTGRIIESPEVSEAVLWDFRDVVEDLLTVNYFGTMQSLANAHGLKTYSESQGGPLNPMANNRYVDVPMNEFWMPDASNRATRIKQSVSSASFQGRGVVAAEAFTATPENGRYQNTPARLKGPGDHAFTLGINRFAFHSHTHQPVTEAAPGFALGRYGTHFGRLNTWWPYVEPWIAYLSRSQFLLQQGRVAADVCLLVDEDIGYGLPARVATMFPGYDFEACYPHDLRKMTVEDGVLVHPAGGRFRLLMTPNNWIASTWVAEMPTLRHIRDLVHAGAALTGDPPVAPAGLNDLAHREEFNRIVDEIWGGLDGGTRSKQVGAGRVYGGLPAVDILKMEGVGPDFSWSSLEADLKFIRRTTFEADIYFIYNYSDEPIRTDMHFRQSERRPEIWNPVSGVRAHAPVFSVTKDGVSVPFDFAPRGSTFVVFRRPLPERWVVGAESVNLELANGELLVADETATLSYSDGDRNELRFGQRPASVSIEGPWQVSFVDGRGAPEQVVLDRLICWTEHADPGVRHYSGTAVYSTAFEARRPESNQAAILDLGDVSDIARLVLNGEQVGILWTPPFRADIAQYLRDGTNTLEVHVANRWINRLIGDEAIEVNYAYQEPGRSRFTDGRLLELPAWLYNSEKRSERRRHSFSIWKHYNADDPLVSSGLLGPVTIEWFHRFDVSSSR
jgi:hypothetical protein